MAQFKEYDQYDSVGLAELVRKKELTANELCEEAIRRAEALNPTLNAIVTEMYNLVNEQIEKISIEAPFYGVPILLKDAHHAFKGVAMSQGSEVLKNDVSDYDAEIVRRFKNAGFVVIGKTNTPEFKLAYVTEPKAFGPTRNPWKTEYSSGGSSGGSAAAVASRIVPMASATDEGGSIRVPASYCGMFGLKPSRGRNPVGPNFGNEWDGMSTSHVITRTVRDSAAILDAISGIEPGAPYSIEKPEGSYINETNNEPKKLRIAFNARSAYGQDVHPECKKAVEETAKLLEDMGHDVDEASPDYREEEAALNHIYVLAVHLASHLDKIALSLNRSVKKIEVELTSLAMSGLGRKLKALDIVEAKEEWRKLGYLMANFHQKYDILMNPTLGIPPVMIGSQEPGSADRMSMKMLNSFIGKILLSSRGITYKIMKELINNLMKGQMNFTMIANITGQPAMSVPLHWTENGLPCGIQFMGRFGDESTLLRLAGQLEKARPWFDKKPDICL